jgi:putative peptidoglycan lipid II flippase
MVVKVTATMKELVVAYQFGTGDAVDAFLIAFLLPSLIVNIVAGSFTPAFTPVYIEVREIQGASPARRLFGSAMAGSTVLIVVATCVLLALMPIASRLLSGSFSAEKLALTRALFLLLLPIIVLSSVFTLWSAVLNAEEQFWLVALAPACVPLLALVTVMVAGRAWGIHALAYGTVFGYCAQCGILVVALAREGMPLVPRWGGLTPELRRIGLQYVPMAAGALLTSSSWAIGQAMAATLPAGSVATLNYGNKVVGIVAEISGTALATAVLPHFSVMVARREWPAIRKTLRVYSKVIALGAVPGVLGLILASNTIVRLLFERGAFTAADTTLVASVQALYLLQLPFVLIGVLLVRLASSLQKNQILLLGAAITLPLNVGLNLLFMRWLGVAGIALATSVVFVVSCCYLAVSLRRALRLLEHRYPASPSPLV